jgi:hypothetical protein
LTKEQGKDFSASNLKTILLTPTNSVYEDEVVTDEVIKQSGYLPNILASLSGSVV